MPCPPINLTTGLFIDAMSTSWSSAPSQTAGGRTVTRTASGISVTSPTGSVYHPTLGSYTSRYMFFGTDNNLLILDIEGGGGTSTRHVTLVDFTPATPVERHLLTVLASGAGVPPPNVQFSQGTGAAVLLFASNGTEITNCTIWRSSNGDVLCPGPPPWVATGETQGEVTATELRIRYSSGGMSRTSACPRPRGSCRVTPASQTFPEAVMGAAPSMARTTDTFTIANNGTDCLTISAIGNVAPYTVLSTSRPLPANLEPAQTMTVTVEFAPTAVGTYDRTLPVTRTPAVGDAGLVCHGVARAAVRSITISPGALGFGSVPVGSASAPLVARVRNNGDVPITVTWPASSGGAFSWAASPTPDTLAPTAYKDLSVTFRPAAEGVANGTVPITHDATIGPTSVGLSGTGCVPNAVIAAPPSAPVSFGDVQRGFRMVRFLTVRNTGDASLVFQASITGPDAALFSIVDPGGSITGGTPSRSYAVDPVTRCGGGPTGTGRTVVAVVFLADAAPDTTVDAQLVVDAHNGSNTTPASYTYPLTATVRAGIPVDAVAVLDRSGSMSEPAGPRTKTDVEVSAGTLLAQLIRENVEDRLGVVKFNEVPVVIQPIVAVTTANHAAITATINPAALTPTGMTGIAGGLILAFGELATPRTTVPPQLTKAVVVLTDGKDNTAYLNPADGRWYSLLGGMARRPGSPFGRVDTDPVPVPSGVRVYGIGLGNEENIDHGRLDALAGGSGGYFGIVGTDLTGPAYFNLEKYFTQIYMNLVGTSPLLDPVFTIAPGERHRIEFDVLRGDVGALVVLYDTDGWRLPFHVETPTGELIEASHVPPGFQLRSGYTSTARFVELLVPAGEPERYAGRWAVVVEHDGKVCYGDPVTMGPQDKERGEIPWGFRSQKCRRRREAVAFGVAIGVGSNLRMQPYVTPGIVRTGEPILLTAVLTEAGLPVRGAAVTVHAQAPSGATWTVELRDDGTHNDGPGDDGEYARLFTHTYEAGSYAFTFRAEATSRDDEPTVREAVLAKYVEGRVKVGPQPNDCCAEPPTDEERDRWLEEMEERQRKEGVRPAKQ